MSLQKAAEKILRDIIVLKSNESLLIVTDKNKKEIAEVFFEEGKKITGNIKIIKIPVAEVHGQEPNKKVSDEMLRYDVELLITIKSLSHTKARNNASKKGARIASMPFVTEEMLVRFSKTNFKKMFSLGKKLVNKFDGINNIRVTTEKGTDFTFKVKSRTKDIIHLYVAEKLDKKGGFSNIPCGEACCMPIERTTNGIVIIDTSVLDELVDRPIEVNIENGFGVKIKGEKSSQKLSKELNKFGKKAYAIAELGIGINETAIITGNILEDEKVLGTCHIAFGNNMSFIGGTNDIPIHLDCVIDKPTIYFDDKKIMEKGQFLIK